MNAKKHHRTKTFSLGLFVALAGTALAAPAHARSVPGNYGVSRHHSHCLTDYSGSIQNKSTDPSCAIAFIRFPLVMDWAGRVGATIHGVATDVDHNVSCRGITMTNGDGSWVLWPSPTPWVSFDTFGVGDTIWLSWDAPANGASYVECQIRQNSWINVVEW